MDNNKMADKIQHLIDIEAIKDLKYHYANGCDRLINEGVDHLLELFTPDVVWDGGAFGKYEGIEAMKTFAREAPSQLKFTYHYFTNPIIRVEGDTAQAQWYLWALYTMPDGQDMVLTGTEYDRYKKIEGKWLISEMKLVPSFFVPYKQGWGQAAMES